MEKNFKSFKQAFSSIVSTYSLNQETNRLVRTGFRDIEKEINAHYETCLDYILDKFLNVNNFNDNFNIIETDSVIEVPVSQTKFDTLNQGFMYFEELRKKYNIPESVNNFDIPKYLEKIKSDVSLRIDELKKQNVNNVNNENDEKEIKNDEKEIKEETK